MSDSSLSSAEMFCKISQFAGFPTLTTRTLVTHLLNKILLGNIADIRNSACSNEFATEASVTI